MKHLFGFALVSFMCAVTSTVWAQSCASPQILTSGATNVSGTTVGGDTTVGAVCGGITLTGPVQVYTWTNNGGAVSGTIAVTPSNANFDVALAVGDGATCAAATGTCDGTADANGAGGAESVSLSGLTNKTFYLFVTSFASGGATTTSGPYNIDVGTLPVKLQKFSVN